MTTVGERLSYLLEERDMKQTVLSMYYKLTDENKLKINERIETMLDLKNKLSFKKTEEFTAKYNLYFAYFL